MLAPDSTDAASSCIIKTFRKERADPEMKRYTASELKQLSKEDMISLVMQLQKQNAFFEERLAASNAARFGRKTETLEALGQLNLFNEVETAADEKAAEPAIISKASGKKQKGKRKQDLSKLPRTVVSHELSDAELTEVFGTNKWTRLADEVYCKVEYHPAWQEVLEHHVAVYAGKKNNSDERTVVRAKHSVDLIEKSIATPSLVAAVMNAKYVNAMPLYRIEQEFQRQDLNISRQNMANWVILSTDRCLSKMYDLLHKKLCGQHVIQADETTVKVVRDGRSAQSNSYMHVFRTGEFQTENPIILYKYAPNRGHQVAAAFLTDFSGFMESDAFSGYKTLERENSRIRACFCWAHARRDFANAIKALKPEEKALARGSVAETALEKIAEIYRLENELKTLTPKERLCRRQKDIAPLVEDYFAWVKQESRKPVLSEYTTSGLRYSLNQEQQLRMFLTDGEIPIDNSATERAIRPFTVGRANWHLIDTPKGAEASAIVYSIVETAKANHLKPYEYLEFLLQQISTHLYSGNYNPEDDTYLEKLLPWAQEIPQRCRKTSL